MPVLGRRKLKQARSLLRPLPPGDPTGAALSELIQVPGGERYWPTIDAIDWQLRLVPGTPRKECERKLMATSHRLLVLRVGGIEAVDYDDCEPFRFRRMGNQRFVTAESHGQTLEFSTHWAAAQALADVLNEQRREFRSESP